MPDYQVHDKESSILQGKAIETEQYTELKIRVQNKQVLHAVASSTNHEWLRDFRNRRKNHNRLHCLQEFVIATMMRQRR